jgi:hypothetical protein
VERDVPCAQLANAAPELAGRYGQREQVDTALALAPTQRRHAKSSQSVNPLQSLSIPSEHVSGVPSQTVTSGER